MTKATYMQDPSGFVFTSFYPEAHPSSKTIKATEGKALIKSQTVAELLDLLAPGDTVYTVLRHLAPSGMSRRISLIVIKDGQPLSLDGMVSRVLGAKRSAKGGLIATGCGMDMGFELVYRLGSVLWPKGTPAPHSTRNGEPDTCGGYALKQSWL